MSTGLICGDVGIVKQFDGKCLIALTDGLGHGQKAYEAAELARGIIDRNYREDPVLLMKRLHQELKRTIGGVVAICVMDIESGKLEHVGIGNITTRVLGKEPVNIVPKDGVVGYMISSPSKRKVLLSNGDILLVYSDGIKAQISYEENKQLFAKSAQKIAEGIITKYGKQKDDNSCLVLKYFK